MNISNVKIYDLEESIVASGLPMLTSMDAAKFEEEAETLRRWTVDETNPHYQRALRLAAAPDGSGHKNFLSGIIVSFNVRGSNAWWMQFERYHFAQIVSSQSKMHRLKQMIEQNVDMPLVSTATIDHLRVWYDRFSRGEITEEELIYECPVGLELTARVTTNYLQLRTIYTQRKNHKLQEWRDFCAWIASLPHAREFITLESEEEKDEEPELGLESEDASAPVKKERMKRRTAPRPVEVTFKGTGRYMKYENIKTLLSECGAKYVKAHHSHETEDSYINEKARLIANALAESGHPIEKIRMFNSDGKLVEFIILGVNNG